MDYSYTSTHTDNLQRLFDVRREAERRLKAAQTELKLAEAAAEVANLRYRRQALWLRADELRNALERVEAEAANIQIPKGDA